MESKLTQTEDLKKGDSIFYNDKIFLVDSLKINENNKNFLFIVTTSNKKIELPKEFWLNKIT